MFINPPFILLLNAARFHFLQPDNISTIKKTKFDLVSECTVYHTACI